MIVCSSVALTNYLSDLSDSSLSLDICGFQWYWAFDTWSINLHSHDFISVGSIRLLDTSHTILFNSFTCYTIYLSSIDVIHSLSFPILGVKLDAIPGRLSVGSILCYFDGIFYGHCTELCGSLHGFMPFRLLVI